MSLSNTYPDKAPQAASRVIDGEAVIIMPDENTVRVLNEAGSCIWELLNGNRGIDRIAAHISEEYEVSYDIALKDAIEFIDDLHQRGMVVLLEDRKEEQEK